MQHERNLQEQTHTIDQQKQDRTLLVKKGDRPEKAREGMLLFDGDCLCVRHNDKWKIVGSVIQTEEEEKEDT